MTQKLPSKRELSFTFIGKNKSLLQSLLQYDNCLVDLIVILVYHWYKRIVKSFEIVVISNAFMREQIFVGALSSPTLQMGIGLRNFKGINAFL